MRNFEHGKQYVWILVTAMLTGMALLIDRHTRNDNKWRGKAKVPLPNAAEIRKNVNEELRLQNIKV